MESSFTTSEVLSGGQIFPDAWPPSYLVLATGNPICFVYQGSLEIIDNFYSDTTNQPKLLLTWDQTIRPPPNGHWAMAQRRESNTRHPIVLPHFSACFFVYVFFFCNASLISGLPVSGLHFRHLFCPLFCSAF